MVHRSGNSTWQAFPSTATKVTAVSLENLETAIDESLEAVAANLSDIDDANIVFAITSDENERSWLEINSEGKPTTYSRTLLNEVSRAAGLDDGVLTLPMIDSDLAAGMAVPFESETSGYVYVITGSDGKIVFGIRTDGTILATVDTALNVPVATPTFEVSSVHVSTTGSAPSRKIRVLDNTTGKVTILGTGDTHSPRVTRLPRDATKGVVLFTEDSVDKYYNLSTGVTLPVVGQPLVFPIWGDSLTNRGGIRNALAAAMPGKTVIELGAEGQTSREIMARQGGITVLTTSAVTIPTSGSVVVPVSVAFAWHDGTNNDGSLLGIPGTMNSAEDRTHTFTPSVYPGSPVVVPSGTPWVSGKALQYQNAVPIFFVGRNDVTQGKTAQEVIDMVAAGVLYLNKNYFEQYLILSTTTATTEVSGTANYIKIKAINDALSAKYGPRFVDIRRYLIDNATALFAAQSLTPTGADTTALTGDTIPPSFMLPADTIHFTTFIQEAIGTYIYTSKLVPLGWN
jgi:hypothetical protein